MKATLKTDPPQEVEAKIHRLWWQEKGLSFTDSGYGTRIPTCHMVFYEGVWRRVYCRIFSNVGTCFIGKDLKSGIIVSEVHD